MIESVQIRQRGAYDFETHYDSLCGLQDSCPLTAAKAHLSQGILDINGDRVRANDWLPILNTLKINKSLEFVALRSFYTHKDEDKKSVGQKRKMPAVRSKEITYGICKALHGCLSVTPVLACIELQSLPLRERDLMTLTKGITKNNTLSHLSLDGCRIGDHGLDILSAGLKTSTTINSVNFSGCSIGWKGAEVLAKVIKHQAMKRHSEAWRDSLRYRRPDLDRMPGIRRITLYQNPRIGDQGIMVLAEALKDDLWVKALDMQSCGISSAGAQSLLEVLKYNTTLVVLDVRLNHLIDRDLLHNIMEQLMINSNGQDTTYKWITTEEPLEQGKKTKKRKVKPLNGSTRRKVNIKISAANRSREKNLPDPHPSAGQPWRTAARANRYRGYPPEGPPNMSSVLASFEGDGSFLSMSNPTTSVMVTNDCSSDEAESIDTMHEMQKLSKSDDNLVSLTDLRVDVVQNRRRLKEEIEARGQADQRVIELTLLCKKLQNENVNLKNDVEQLRQNRSSIFEDDSFLDTIESAFNQFHSFLDHLRETGFGHLVKQAGLDKPFNPFALYQTFSQLNRSAAPSTRSHGQSSMRSPVHQPKSGFYGDINSTGIEPVSYEERGPITINHGVTFPDYDPDEKYSFSVDPTMETSSDFVYPTTRNTDDLYERLLHTTKEAMPLSGGKTVDLDDSYPSTLENTPIILATSPDKSKRSKLKQDRKQPAVNLSDNELVTVEDKAPDDEGSDKKGHERSQGEENLSRDRRDDESRPGDRREAGDGIAERGPGNDNALNFDQSYVSGCGELIHFDESLESLHSPAPSPPPSEKTT